jgi:hypothetical protein
MHLKREWLTNSPNGPFLLNRCHTPNLDRHSHLQSNGIVHGMSQRLLCPQVALRGLDRGMAEEQLDLLQLPARLAAEFGAGAAQVVRREPAEIGGLGITHHQAPDCLFVPDLGAYDDIALVHGPEDAASGNPGRAQPGVDPGLDPRCRFSFTSRLLLLISEHLHVPVTSRNVP